jgi:hypothetical protein
MNFLDANGDGVITKKDLKALKKAGYLEGISASQAYKQLDANRDGVVDPYEAARLFGGQAGGLGPYGFQPNPYQGYTGVPTAYAPPPPPGIGVGVGMQNFQGIPGVNPINGLNNFQPMAGGLNGLNGVNGMNGINGLNGMNGINGLGNYPAFGDFNNAYGSHNVPGVGGGFGFGY